MSLFDGLKRRNVFRVATACVVSPWLASQVVETIFPAVGFGDAAVRIINVAFAIGRVPMVVFAWVFEPTPEGLGPCRQRQADGACNRLASCRVRFVFWFKRLPRGEVARLHFFHCPAAAIVALPAVLVGLTLRARPGKAAWGFPPLPVRG